MVERDLLESSYEGPVLKLVMSAFETLTRYGVFTLQIEQNKAEIVGSFEEETPEKLAELILQVQLKNRALLALHELGAPQTERNDRES